MQQIRVANSSYTSSLFAIFTFPLQANKPDITINIGRKKKAIDRDETTKITQNKTATTVLTDLNPKQGSKLPPKKQNEQK